MLAHDAWEGMDGSWDEGVRFLEFPKSEVKGFFVSVEVLIIKVGIFVEPKSELESGPASLFVDEDLAGFEFLFAWRTQSATAPDGKQLLVFDVVIIRPKDGASRMELGRVKQKPGIGDGYVVGIQQENFAKRGMKDGIRLEFPSAETAGGRFSAEFGGVDA